MVRAVRVSPLCAADGSIRRNASAGCGLLSAAIFLVTAAASAGPPIQDETPQPARPDIAAAGQIPPAPAAAADTLWFAEWTFDGGSGCNGSGWQILDNRILNDGRIYWTVGSNYSGGSRITAKAAILGYTGNACCVEADGYANDWYQAIRMQYSGSPALSFDYLLDSEEGFDFLQVETDSACASFDRVDYNTAPASFAAQYRHVRFSDSGYRLPGRVSELALTNYGPGTHCLYIAFFSDAGDSPCDGGQPSTLGRALVVDNIQIGTFVQDFEGAVEPEFFVNLQDSVPFGVWARLYPHPTDNDLCAENTTCAWTFYDRTLSALTPAMAFGPEGAVVRNWLDNVVLSPWVRVPPTPYGVATVIQFREFGGNAFSKSAIVRNWALRGKRRVDNTESPTPGDSVDCVGPWSSSWSALSSFRWITRTFQAPVTNPDPSWPEVQVRFRVSDWQLVAGAAPPSPLDPGPGPYIDHVRLGRRSLRGPSLSDGFGEREAQDAFASDPAPMSGSENYVPSTDRFGTSDFAMSAMLMAGSLGRTWVKRGDSVVVQVQDVRQAGGIMSVEWHGAIVEGPHMGKAPPPWSVGSNGFFTVPASPSALQGYWFVDLDDDYFRGGDVLLYFWNASDAAGGFASLPDGLDALPASVSAAEAATGGLLEVSYLPAIDWDPGYLARIAAHASGKLEPTPAELANSRQRTCILYDQWVNLRRRSGQRTSMMYTLDRLGYSGLYDVYDHQGEAINYNNHLAGRATVEQATGYAVLIYDTGFVAFHALSPGGQRERWFPQTQWLQDWLAQAPQSEAGRATLWLLGEDLVQANSTFPNPLLVNEMGVTLAANDQGLGFHPDVRGEASFTWADGAVTDFTGQNFNLDATAACTRQRNYDALGATGTAVVTHRYASGAATGDGAVVMNANPAAHWNTVMMSFWWSDVRMAGPGDSPARDFMAAILDAALPTACQAVPDPTTDVPGPGGEVDALPRVTVLHPNAPNPFNPATTIRFDLGRTGHVTLGIYDAAGRLVRTLVNAELRRDRHQVTWDGLDAAGRRVPSGVYIGRLVTDGVDIARKLVVLR